MPVFVLKVYAGPSMPKPTMVYYDDSDRTQVETEILYWRNQGIKVELIEALTITDTKH